MANKTEELNESEGILHRDLIRSINIHSNKTKECMICKNKGLTNNIIPYGYNKLYTLRLCSKCCRLYANKEFVGLKDETSKG